MNYWANAFPPRRRLKHIARRGDRSVVLDDKDRDNVRLMRELLGGMPTSVDAIEPKDAIHAEREARSQ